MNSNRKRLYTIAGVFAFLLLIGIVYAATTGTLNFNGTAGFNTNVRLIIVDEAITSEKSGESVSTNAAKDTLTFSVHLSEPNETRYVRFKVENVGNSDAILGALSTTPPAANSGITISWPTLDGDIIAVGETSPSGDEYTIAVTWNPSYPDATQDVTLTASIGYSQHTTP